MNEVARNGELCATAVPKRDYQVWITGSSSVQELLRQTEIFALQRESCCLCCITRILVTFVVGRGTVNHGPAVAANFSAVATWCA